MGVLTNTMSDSFSVNNFATGQLSTDASAAAAFVLNLGFTARKFRIVSVTGANAGNQDEWIEGMGNSTIHTIPAGTQTIPTTGQIAISDRAVTLAATIMAVSSTFVWEAQG